ncbi:MAG: tetratricopeptide repeat protein [Chloroflexi bacterium]|nr:tetratricopeptide repeat protein [Chloroflexota bacterium]
MAEHPTFGEWLRKRRRAMDLSQRQLAALAGCAEITLRRIEAGSLKPSRELAALLLEKLGVPPEERGQWVRFARGMSEHPSEKRSAAELPARTNLPTALTAFVGRERELADIEHLLSLHRLVSLTGVGGIGKTRLAAKAGERLLRDYPDGVWLIELAAASTDLVARSIAAVLGLQSFNSSAASITQMVINSLRTKQALLILDNCEHLVSASADIARLVLSRCSAVRILTTSREPLGIDNEITYAVPPLELPSRSGAPAEVQSSDSTRLFLERARLRNNRIAANNADLSFAVQICHRLEGIPLALELAAAQSDWISLAEIAAQLEKSFEILSEANRAVPVRQQSLRASLEWSWGLLTDQERVLMRRLAVFFGSWTLEAAQKVCSDERVTAQAANLHLRTLVRKSLVRVIQRPEHETRYAFHEIIYHYTREKLVASGEFDRLAQRHLDAVLEFVRVTEDKLHSAEEKHLIEQLTDDLPNIRAVLEYSLTHDPESVLRLAAGLGWFWFRSGLFHEGRQWLDRAVTTHQRAFAQQNPLPPEQAGTLQKALYAGGLLAHYQGDYVAARTLAQDSLTIAQTLGDPCGIANSLCLIADGLMWQEGNLDSALEHILEGIDLLRESGTKWELASALSEMGFVLLAQRKHREARTVLEEGLQLARAAGDRWIICVCLSNLGSLSVQVGDLEQGYRLLEESLAIAEDVRDVINTSWAMKELAQVSMQLGDHERASELYRAVLEECRMTGIATGEADALRALGQLALGTGDYAAAEGLLRNSLKIYGHTEERGIAVCLLSFCELAKLRGDFALAVVLLGVVDQQVARITLSPLEKTQFERLKQACQVEAHGDEFTTLWNKGRQVRLSLVQQALLASNPQQLIDP